MQLKSILKSSTGGTYTWNFDQDASLYNSVGLFMDSSQNSIDSSDNGNNRIPHSNSNRYAQKPRQRRHRRARRSRCKDNVLMVNCDSDHGRSHRGLSLQSHSPQPHRARTHQKARRCVSFSGLDTSRWDSDNSLKDDTSSGDSFNKDASASTSFRRRDIPRKPERRTSLG